MQPAILHIDNDPFFLQIYARSFQRENFRSKSARSAEEAWRSVEDEMPDVIVLDVITPDRTGSSDGFEMLEALKTKAQTKHIPVVMMSDLSSKEDVDQCLRLGAEAYLLKAHHDTQDLVACIKRCLK